MHPAAGPEGKTDAGTGKEADKQDSWSSNHSGDASIGLGTVPHLFF